MNKFFIPPIFIPLQGRMIDYPSMLSGLFSPEGLLSLATLSLLEIILGIDNIIFIAIVADRLPKINRKKARTTGLLLAVLIRIVLLFTLSFLSTNNEALFQFLGKPIAIRDLVFMVGGVFLLYKTTQEIMEKVSGKEDSPKSAKTLPSITSVIVQIVFIDIVFSFDSILTAVAISRNILIMCTAVIIALAIMVLFSGAVSEFINRNPRMKMLALAFLLVISLVLISEATAVFTGFIIPKSYVYAALGFSLVTETLNILQNRKKK